MPEKMNKAAAIKKLKRSMQILGVLGILLSVYALYVETKKESDNSYQAMCDISSYISCSRVFTSEYGRGFGIIGKYLGEDHYLNQPNSIPGISFYVLIIGLSFSRSYTLLKVQYVVVSLSNFMSLYLAYILYFILHDFCIVCISTYIINLLLTFCSYRLIALVGPPQKKKQA